MSDSGPANLLDSGIVSAAAFVPETRRYRPPWFAFFKETAVWRLREAEPRVADDSPPAKSLVFLAPVALAAFAEGLRGYAKPLLSGTVKDGEPVGETSPVLCCLPPLFPQLLWMLQYPDESDSCCSWRMQPGVCAVMSRHRLCTFYWGTFDNGTDPVLLQVAAHGDTDGVALALTLGGADPADRSSTRNETALHVAARHGNFAMASVLVRAGAPLDARDDTGRLPRDLVLPEFVCAAELRILLDPNVTSGDRVDIATPGGVAGVPPSPAAWLQERWHCYVAVDFPHKEETVADLYESLANVGAIVVARHAAAFKGELKRHSAMEVMPVSAAAAGPSVRFVSSLAAATRRPAPIVVLTDVVEGGAEYVDAARLACRDDGRPGLIITFVGRFDDDCMRLVKTTLGIQLDELPIDFLDFFRS